MAAGMMFYIYFVLLIFIVNSQLFINVCCFILLIYFIKVVIVIN